MSLVMPAKVCPSSRSLATITAASFALARDAWAATYSEVPESPMPLASLRRASISFSEAVLHESNLPCIALAAPALESASVAAVTSAPESPREEAVARAAERESALPEDVAATKATLQSASFFKLSFIATAFEYSAFLRERESAFAMAALMRAASLAVVAEASSSVAAFSSCRTLRRAAADAYAGESVTPTSDAFFMADSMDSIFFSVTAASRALTAAASFRRVSSSFLPSVTSGPESPISAQVARKAERALMSRESMAVLRFSMASCSSSRRCLRALAWLTSSHFRFMVSALMRSSSMRARSRLFTAAVISARRASSASNSLMIAAALFKASWTRGGFIAFAAETAERRTSRSRCSMALVRRAATSFSSTSLC
mmetsp:Transcript_8525/g.17265  ORF Transcript_8525/g.17265 Transcript_8525/m.17265 type:complete len:374 (+) Transcript_8525:2725-3846(+)